MNRYCPRLKLARLSAVAFVLSLSNTPMNVEIQYDLCGATLREVMDKLNLSYTDGETRKIYLFDDADQAFSKNGFIFRLRRTESKTVFTIKIRDVDPDKFSAEFFADKNFKCEIDKHIEKTYTSCSLNSKPEARKIEEVLNGKKSLRSIFSKAQKYFAHIVGVDDNKIDTAKQSSVAQQRVWKFALDNIADDVALEYTKRGGTERIELSARVSPARSLRVEKLLLNRLNDLDLNVCTGM